ncbi:cytochrome c oxidase assembly protein [Paenibacillus sepulcri]|uniref:Cytochrome c oxidase assembly protein n=2 Tax=Paenibacillus sepulcri TaxID=359917 RepID=A0ABS7C3N6_9BACL|nr:cytochrome c oxidase assembly protein [Paenibacillus sepulcri]
MLVALIFFAITMLYIGAVVVSNRHYRKWPRYRIYCWCAGVWCAALAIIGPLADRGHTDFTAHMTGHLLLGMLAPLLTVLAAPAALVLRSLKISSARRFSRILKSRFMHFFMHPFTASLLDIGGLWVLYTTGLYEAMHKNMLINIAVHIHVFLAGYLFTASIIYMNPVSHRFSFKYRAAMLIMAFAGHSILSKIIYASPQEGVPIEQVKNGAQFMYFGGDAIELLMITIFCYQWYKGAVLRNQ